jgi:hypothetical protein
LPQLGDLTLPLPSHLESRAESNDHLYDYKCITKTF